MMKADLHVHSSFSTDSTSSMEEMIRKGIALGLYYICFTDHMDYDYPGTVEGEFLFDPEKYFQTFEDLISKYQKKITILRGIEIGMQEHLSESFQNLIQRYPFDFVICSSHVTEGLDPYYPAFWENHSTKEALTAYFQSILDNITVFEDFDVYGHIDYIIRYAPSPIPLFEYSTYSGILDEILKTLIQKNKGLEVNSAGFKYGLGHPHPHESILSRYYELGGRLLTIGSDAHQPEHLAFDFERTRKLLLSLGFSHYAVFGQRTPVFFPL